MSQKLKDLCKLFKIPDKGDTVQFKGQHWEDMDQQAMKEYCLNDVDREYDLLEILLPRIDNLEFELQLMQHTLNLYLRPPFKLDVKLANEISDGMKKALRDDLLKVRWVLEYADKKKKTISDILRARTIFPKILADILPEGEEIPMKPGKNKMIPALAQQDVGFQLLLVHPDEKVRDLMAAKAAVTSWPLHKAKVDSIIAQASHSNNMMRIPLKYYGAHCLTGDAEVLTREGWAALANWDYGEIMQWSPSGKMDFRSAQCLSFGNSEPMIGIDSPYIVTTMTKGHTVPRFGSGNKSFMPCKAGDLLDKGISYLPISGISEHQGEITADQMRVLVAVQADGSWQLKSKHGRELRFCLTKNRKQKRFREIFDAAGVKYREGIYDSHPGEISFRIKWIDLPDWLVPERKVFGSWLLDSTPDAREAFIGELVHWDGHKSGNLEYYSRIGLNHEWVAIMAHLTGRGAKRGKNGATIIRETRDPQRAIVARNHVGQRSPINTVYCPVTETGYFLVRDNKTIFITGNTGRWSGTQKTNPLNLGGKGRGKAIHPLIGKVRHALLAPEGKMLTICDSAQIEARELAWVAGQDDLAGGFARGEDIYSVFATRLFGEEVRKPREGDDPEVAKILDIRRGFGKDAILGCGYGMGSDTFLLRCKQNGSLRPLFDSGEYDAAFIEKLIKTYRATYTKIPEFWREIEKCFRWVTKYHNEVISYHIPDDNTCLHTGMEKQKPIIKNALLTFWRDGKDTVIQLPSGRCLYYRHAVVTRKKELKYVWGPLWGGTLTENVIQAMCRDLLAGWLLECEHNDIPIILHTYDELVGCVPEDRSEEALSKMIEIMNTGPAWAEGLPLATEGEVSKCYKK